MEAGPRDELHRLLEELPEHRLPEARQFLEELSTAPPDEEMSPDTLTAIEEGLEDIRRGKTMTVEQYRRSRKL